MTVVTMYGWLADFQCKRYILLAVPLKSSVSNGGSEDLPPLTVPSGVNERAVAGHFAEPQVPTTLTGSCEKQR